MTSRRVHVMAVICMVVRFIPLRGWILFLKCRSKVMSAAGQENVYLNINYNIDCCLNYYYAAPPILEFYMDKETT